MHLRLVMSMYRYFPSFPFLKGQCHEIFCFRFFSWISFPQALEYTIRAVSNFFENSRRYSQLKVDHRYQRHRGVNDAGGKIAAGINDTGGKFASGIKRHRRQILPSVSLVLLTPVANLPLVSAIPAANLPPVSTTPVANCHLYQRHAQLCLIGEKGGAPFGRARTFWKGAPVPRRLFFAAPQRIAITLKGQCHEIFCFWFFLWISFPPAPEYPIKTIFKFFPKVAEIFAAQGWPPGSLTPVANEKKLQSEKF